MRRTNDSQTPFDVEADDAADATREFWGTTPGWVSDEHQRGDDVHRRDDARHDARGDDTTGSLRAVRAGIAAFRPKRVEGAAQRDRTREHGIVRPAPSAEASREATLGELAGGHTGTDAHDPHPSFDGDSFFDLDAAPLDEPTREFVPVTATEPRDDRLGLAAIDPLLLRIGIILVIGVLLVPIALAFGSGDDDGSIQTPVGALVPFAAGPAPEAAALAEPAPAVDSDAAPAAEPVTASDQVADPTSAPAESAESTGTAAPTAAAPESVSGTPAAAPLDNGATATEVAERVVPECPQTYEAGAGDSWYRIASASGITPGALLGENNATIDTVIFPGDEICLPAGATVPAQPAPATSDTPATTAAPSTTPTTAAPTTTAAPPPPPAPAEVEQIIRDIWPDELEEKALQIAYRESRYDATAYNGWCCYGLFQIYWTVHDGWLDDYGIYTSNDLLDARKNTTAAYAIYQRSGGWGPWGG